jgi:hypothetical protein
VKQFKENDTEEAKYIAVVNSVTSAVSDDIADLYADGYDCEKLGQAIFNEQASILTNAIKEEIFIRSFNEVFENWQFAGTFDCYINIFQKIFGDDTEVLFTSSSVNHLHITINTGNIENYLAVAREVVDSVITDFPLMVTYATGSTARLIFPKLVINDISELDGVLRSTQPAHIYTTFEINYVP